MPLFSKKGPKVADGNTSAEGFPYSNLNNNNSSNHNNNNNNNNNHHSDSKSSHNGHSGGGGKAAHHSHSSSLPESSTAARHQLVFHCQLAHGSPTGLITGFASVRELYKKIADCYDIPEDDIMYCTLNSHKVDMTKLLGNQIGLEDFIFAHRKGRPKEIEILKEEDALGLTITDNGAGYAFIKRIKEGSVIDRIEHIGVGDFIEKLNGESMVGKRHYEVARALKEIPTGSTFTVRIVEPQRSGFQGIGPRSQSKAPSGRGYGSGKETLRFKANGNVQIEDKCDEATQSGIEAINNLLESFMGINDTELATQIWDLGCDKTNSMDFAEAIDNSDLESFGFTDDFIIELWGAITDARRLKAAAN